MSTKRKTVISLVINCVIVIATIGVVISYFLGNDGEYHIPPYFRFFLFTTESNLLCMAASLALAVFEIRYLRTGKAIPRAALALKFVGATATALTFAVVVFFLGPMMGFVSMVFGGTSLYMHFLGPIFAFVSFCFFEDRWVMSKKMLLAAMIPTLAYAALYLTMVFAVGEENGGWYDFYGFNVGGFWYLTSTAILLATLGLAALIRLIHNRCASRNARCARSVNNE